MTYVIRHPARLDLFDNGEGQWGPLSQAKRFDHAEHALLETQRGEVVVTAPEKQPIHPFYHTST